MALRIVDEQGLGYTARIFDAETGEDLTARLRVAAIDLHMRPNEAVSVHITSYAPKIDLTVPEAQVSEVCPYCGHAHEFVRTLARNLAATLSRGTENENGGPGGGEARWQCQECGESFRKQIDVERLVWLRDNPREKKHVCAACHKRLTREKKIIREAK